MLRDIGFLDLIKKGFYYRDNDPDVLIIQDKLDNHINKHLFYGRKHGNDFNKILNSVFKSLGITVQRGKKCQKPCYKLIKSDLFTLTYDAIQSRFGADGADVAIKDTKRITARTAPTNVTPPKQSIEKNKTSNDAKNENHLDDVIVPDDDPYMDEPVNPESLFADDGWDDFYDDDNNDDGTTEDDFGLDIP